MTYRAVFAIFFLFASPALGSDAVERAESAARQLEAAAGSLQDAERASDRVAALTQTVQAYEAGLTALRGGLRAATLRESELAAEFEAERETLGRMIGILLSMQTSPGPLILLHPSGPVETARAGMIVSDVVPGLRSEVEVLKLKLEEAAVLRLLQESATSQLRDGLDGIQTARSRLSQAIADRTDLPPSVATDAAAMQALINSTDTLDGFAASLFPADLGNGPNELLKLQGKLNMPVSGVLLRGFGEADAAGLARPGLVIATLPRALVVAPFAATVRYVGPLLDYGNVIILEPESGYLLVLAGLDVVYGRLGDVVPAGAPVGMMGGETPQAEAILIETSQGNGQDLSETLYMELREGREPVDPAPWLTGIAGTGPEDE